jgi:hypothetical protein
MTRTKNTIEDKHVNIPTEDMRDFMAMTGPQLREAVIQAPVRP